MKSERLRLAAGACLLSAGLGAALLPSFALTQSRALQLGIPLASLALYLFILFTWRDLLAARFDFPIPQWLLAGLIAGHSGLAIASVLDELGRPVIPLSIALVWAASLAVALSLIVFGFKLLAIRRRLGLLGAIWAVASIVEGLLFGTIVFMASAILIAVLADLVLGLLFLRSAASRSAKAAHQPA